MFKRSLLVLCLSLLTPPAFSENKSVIAPSLKIGFGGDSEQGRDFSITADYFFSNNIGIEIGGGAAHIVNDNERDRTSENFDFTVTSNPEKSFSYGAQVARWGLEDSLEVQTFELQFDGRLQNWNFSLSPGQGVVDAPDVQILNRTYSAKSDMDYVKSMLGYSGVKFWRFKIYFEKYEYEKNLSGLTSPAATLIFTENTLNLATSLLEDLWGLEALYEIHPDWDIGLYLELSQSAVDQSETRLTSLLIDYYYSDPWLFSAEVGSYQPLQNDGTDPVQFLSLSAKYVFDSP